jgi:hypothetical protein
VYNIDPKTGIITVSDKTGHSPDETLSYKDRKTFRANTTFVNGTPSIRRGVEWILDFDKIQALQTSIRIDGNYYYYHGTNETVSAYSPAISSGDEDKSLYRYVGFYVGGHNSSNGFETKRLTSNLTVTTHIPAIRLIVSLRVEGTFYNSRQNLSEYNGGQRSFLLDGKPVLYPLYYVSHEDMNTKIPYAEKLAWARENDAALYNDLVNLVLKPNTDYYFNENKISGYYSANLSITKEIGNVASISFNATNFTNNMQIVTSSNNNVHQTIYENGSNYIPRFYYGLSLRLKL